MTTIKWMTGVALAVALCAAGDVKIIDGQTNQAFDAEIMGQTPGVTLTCTGVGCRKKTTLADKVYAMAQWVDAEAARNALVEWQGQLGAALVADQRFCDALSSADFEKRLGLVFVRDLPAAQIRDGFKAGLAVSYPEKLSPAAEQFLALFTADVKQGQSIELRSLPGGIIDVRQNGVALGALPADRTLATAVWAMYFHEKLPDNGLKALKRQLISRFEAVWPQGE